MKILKILLVLIFSLFVTDNLQYDAEASGRNHVSRSRLVRDVRENLRTSLENLVGPADIGNPNLDSLAELFTQEAEKLANYKEEDTINFLKDAKRVLTGKAWKEYTKTGVDTPDFLTFLTSVSKAWFHTQNNAHNNTLAVEAKEGDKIFLFVSGAVPFTDDGGAKRLKEVADKCATLFNCRKLIEIIDIHTLLNIESSTFKRFIHFSCNFYKDESRNELKTFHSYIKEFQVIEKVVKDVSKTGESGYFNKEGYFLKEPYTIILKGLCQKLLKILSFCEVSEGMELEYIYGIESRGERFRHNDFVKKAIKGIRLYRNSIIKFLSGEISPKQLMKELFSENKAYKFSKDIILLLHTEKILVTGLKCLELPDDTRRGLENIITKLGEEKKIVKSSDKEGDDLYKMLSHKEKLSLVEQFIFKKLIELREEGNKLKGLNKKSLSRVTLTGNGYNSYKVHFINDIQLILGIINQLKPLCNQSLNVVSSLDICPTCQPYINLMVSDGKGTHSVFH